MFPTGSCGGHWFPFGLTVWGRLEKLGPTWRKQVTSLGPCAYLVPAFFIFPCFLSVRKPLPLSPFPSCLLLWLTGIH